MRSANFAVGLALGASLAWVPLAALAADHEAGVPLSPAEAAGAWTLQTDGHAICKVRLSPEKAGNAGFGAQAGQECAGTLPAGITGWAPTGDGMALTGANGAVLISFGRWSNSLFVSHRSSGTDLQLQRGGPNP